MSLYVGRILDQVFTVDLIGRKKPTQHNTHIVINGAECYPQHTTNDGIASTFEMIRTSISTMYTYLKLEHTYNKKNISMQTPAYNMCSLKYEH